MPSAETYQYQEQPPRPQSSAAIQYPQMYSNRYYAHQPHGFDPYYQADDSSGGQRFRVITDLTHTLSPNL